MDDGSPASPETLHKTLGSPLGKAPGSAEEEAVFALGCFWGAERVFYRARGVVTTAVGYTAGMVQRPGYRDVCSGRTGHTEAVRVVFRVSDVSYEDLLALFFESHDPTQGNRQGNDVGTQYRSGIYTTTDAQLKSATAAKASYEPLLMAEGYGSITTEIAPLETFWFAENYHQQYLHKNPAGYCGIGGCNVSFPKG